MSIAIYPGTFDPVTNGHLDVLQRACKIFSTVIIAVADNREKGPLFSVAERIELIRDNIPDHLNAEVSSFEGLLVDYARGRSAIAIIRGLRAISDFEFEFQMTQMNRELEPRLETIFFMPNEEFFYTSSHIVKQVARFNAARISKFVPENVARALAQRYQQA